MAYITNTDIEARLGSQAYVQLTDDDADGVADIGVVNEARLAAEGEVDSYLSRRYEVPINLSVHSELVGLLMSITLDLAEHKLRSRRPPVPPDAIRKYTQAIVWLRDLSEGRVDLPSAAEVAVNTTRGTIAATTGADCVLSREELSEY